MTTALIDWQPLSHLEQENYLLREENRHLHFQTQELMQWKEKALKHMVAMGPKRCQAQQEVKQATQMQRKLQAVEKTLQERVVLEQATMTLQQENEQLRIQVATLEQEKRQANACNAATKDQLIQLAETFRVHLEELVAIRTSLEGAHEEDDDERQTPEVEEQVNPKHGNRVVPGKDSPSHKDKKDRKTTYDDPTLLIEGLTTVSAKCLQWFHHHGTLAFAAIQEEARRYETQQNELKTLRTRVHSIHTDHETNVMDHQQQTKRLYALQQRNDELEETVEKLQRRTHAHSDGHMILSDHIHLLITEVRQYLRLVRSEVKKKFGYVPDAITHTDNWSRIMDAMEILEQHLRV